MDCRSRLVGVGCCVVVWCVSENVSYGFGGLRLLVFYLFILTVISLLLRS